jgi:hypothetical protein
MPVAKTSIMLAERIERTILIIRGTKVMLDRDLANLYGVGTKALNQAVKRNLDRFPPDFMFRLTWDEAEVADTRSQSVTLNAGKRTASRSHSVTLKRGMNVKYRPYAFTEQGVAMLSSVLRSEQAIAVNIEIMRAFVRLRQLLASHTDLARKLDALEKKYDSQFRVVFDAIRQLMEPPPEPGRKRIGFAAEAGLQARSRAGQTCGSVRRQK